MKNIYKYMMAEEREKKAKAKVKFCINDHQDLLVEILKRADGRSLGVAACVCRLWRSITRHDWLWENTCFRHVSPPPYDVRPVVVALGGYRRLYMVCLRPLLNRLSCRLSLGNGGGGGGGMYRESVAEDVEGVRSNRLWTRDEVQLSLSLFSMDYYERLVLGSNIRDEGSLSSSSSSSSSSSTSSSSSSSSSSSKSASSLMFLCKAVNV